MNTPGAPTVPALISAVRKVTPTIAQAVMDIAAASGGTAN